MPKKLRAVPLRVEHYDSVVEVIVRFTCEIESGPDKDGKYRYTLLWTAPQTGEARAQGFNAKLPPELEGRV